MPMIIRTINQIMANEQRDMLFIDFQDGFGPRHSHWRKRHFDWFAANNLRYETAAPQGWLSGDPGIFAVFFDSGTDPRVVAYATEFEDKDGKSLHPDDYQMKMFLYQDWQSVHPNWKPEDDLTDWDSL
jgi:hypothetical protein